MMARQKAKEAEKDEEQTISSWQEARRLEDIAQAEAEADYVGELPDTTTMPEEIPLEGLDVADDGGPQEPTVQDEAEKDSEDIIIDSDGKETNFLSDDDEFFTGPF